jgi:hypothetical protein
LKHAPDGARNSRAAGIRPRSVEACIVPTLIVTLDEVLMEAVSAEATRRSVSPEQAAADMIALRAYEAAHGPVTEEELGDLDAAIAGADRGEFASDAELEMFLRQHGA